MLATFQSTKMGNFQFVDRYHYSSIRLQFVVFVNAVETFLISGRVLVGASEKPVYDSNVHELLMHSSQLQVSNPTSTFGPCYYEFQRFCFSSRAIWQIEKWSFARNNLIDSTITFHVSTLKVEAFWQRLQKVQVKHFDEMFRYKMKWFYLCNVRLMKSSRTHKVQNFFSDIINAFFSFNNVTVQKNVPVFWSPLHQTISLFSSEALQTLTNSSHQLLFSLISMFHLFHYFSHFHLKHAQISRLNCLSQNRAVLSQNINSQSYIKVF